MQRKKMRISKSLSHHDSVHMKAISDGLRKELESIALAKAGGLISGALGYILCKKPIQEKRLNKIIFRHKFA